MNRSRRRAKRKRLDFPRRNRGLSSSSNSGLIRCPLLFLTTLTLSSGSPRFSSAILFSIVFVCDVFRFYRLLLPNFWLPLSSQDGKRRRPKPRTRRFPYRVPEYCYDRGSERKKNQQIIRRTGFVFLSGRNHKNVRVSALRHFPVL